MFASGRDFYICDCRSNDDSAHYFFAPLSSNWHDIIRASSAIPGVDLACISYFVAASAITIRCVRPPAAANVPRHHSLRMPPLADNDGDYDKGSRA